MLEVKTEVSDEINDNNNENEMKTDEQTEAVPEAVVAAVAAAAEAVAEEPTPTPTPAETNAAPAVLNDSAEMAHSDHESHLDTELKGKQRRYWTPKEEERFFEIWGRDNWRLTRHGKNTIYFAQWSDELRERFNIDVKPEEIQCKVNQTRAKFRSVKKLLESDKNVPKWKKFDIVEKILKNQYRSKDDEPVPFDALENNRDMSPSELARGVDTRPSTPCTLNAEHEISLNQSISENVNITHVPLTDHNLTSHVFSSNSQSGTNFSTELFGCDQLDIKKEIDADLASEGFTEFISLGPNELVAATGSNGTTNAVAGQNTNTIELQPNSNQLPAMPANMANQTNNHVDKQNHNANSMPVLNNAIKPPAGAAAMSPAVNPAAVAATQNHTRPMQPPRSGTSASGTAAPRKRGPRSNHSSAAAAPMSQDILENMYLEEVKKKNVILVEQGEINRKRLRLEEKKVKLMEEFFPKIAKLQQDIVQKLDQLGVNASAAIREEINM